MTTDPFARDTNCLAPLAPLQGLHDTLSPAYEPGNPSDQLLPSERMLLLENETLEPRHLLDRDTRSIEQRYLDNIELEIHVHPNF